MPELPSVPPERVHQILCRDPLGAALWRAASHEALNEVLAERIDQLEQQRTPGGIQFNASAAQITDNQIDPPTDARS